MKNILLSAYFWTFFLLPKSTHSLSPSSTLRNNNNIKAAGDYNNKVFILDDQGLRDGLGGHRTGQGSLDQGLSSSEGNLMADELHSDQGRLESEEDELLITRLKRAAQQSGGYGTVGDRRHSRKIKDKLLIIVIDGLRWDYIDRFTKRSGREFPGFSQFARTGVSTRYLTSVFPSEGFPAWQTINTGLYPGNHGIIGNQFWDPKLGIYFNHDDERMTDNLDWWIHHKPIWASAEQSGLKFSAFLWARCDIPWEDVVRVQLENCENVNQKDGSKTLQTNLNLALVHFQQDSSAAIVYEDSLVKTAADFGPLSNQTEDALRTLDDAVRNLQDKLVQAHMDENVNVIILSGHGMTYGSNPNLRFHPRSFPSDLSIKKIRMDKHLRPLRTWIKSVVGWGANMAVYPKEEEHLETILDNLRESLANTGVKVYTSDEIPEHLHIKDSDKIPPVLLLARPGTVLTKVGAHLQRPGRRGGRGYDGRSGRGYNFDQSENGISGYDPLEKDMRGVLMARGPGFKNNGRTYPEIELVDVYNVFCHLLGIDPEDNDGVWNRVKDFLRNGGASLKSASTTILTLIACAMAIRIARSPKLF